MAGESTQRGDGPNVLVLTGIWEPHAFISPVLTTLAAAGFRVHIIRRRTLNLEPVEVLADRAADFLDERDLSDVVAVAHSKGGLVAKQLLINERSRPRMRGAVAICTPFGGSELAGALPEAVIGGLLPGSEELATLAEHTDVNDKIVSLFSAYDPVVPSGCMLPGAHNIEIAEFGHFQLLDDPLVLAAVAEAVNWLVARSPDDQ